MQAWVVDRAGPIDDSPLRRIDRDRPAPGPHQVLVRVSCCGVCRTDLHLAEGDLAPRRPFTIPGHEVVGTIDEAGPGVDVEARWPGLGPDGRLGIAWLAGTDGTCVYCRRGAENLCPASTYTG